mmetsp:Transcript_119350/g.167864  ORF Transcript_119350/g.167864 Transcript_119350/m.167864 type:complete len:129 (-) Transcript_119350:93-479(-)
MKIIDFDLSYKMDSKKKCISRGTKNYRAPELKEGKYHEDGSKFNYQACDIYSLGVILFNLASQGLMPFTESEKEDDIMSELRNLFFSGKTRQFWYQYERCAKIEFSKEFKELINMMMDEDPASRATIE